MSLISKDFRLSQHQPRQKGHFRLRWALLAITCAGIGVVLASTNNEAQSSKAQSVTLNMPVEVNSLANFTPVEPKSNIDTISADVITIAEKKEQESFSISLPKLQALSSTQTIVANQPEKTISTSTPIKTASILPQVTPKLSKVVNNHPNNNNPLSLDITRTLNQNITNIEHKLKSNTTVQWRKFTVVAGDSLSTLFERANVNAQQLNKLLSVKKVKKVLRKIYPKKVVHIKSNAAGQLLALRYNINLKSFLTVEAKNNKFIAKVQNHPLTTRQAHATGTIQSSLFSAAKQAGVSQNIIMELAGIFGWDIDFALDIRRGDKFTVLYEQLYHDDKKVSDGDILAAEFINNGKTYRAVRYTNPDTKVSEYFTPTGRSMRKAFLRTPVNFSRISSHFSVNRYHPILHRFRSHKGVDYAAKRGTPVYAAGNGKIVFKGRKKGYGRVVIVQHGQKYTTLYAHLNSYNRKIRVGRKVTQGQTIAYVGSSGLATGPHLHYEFRVNGVHHNPLTVRLPVSHPVSKRYMANFKSATSTVLAQLDKLASNQQLAFAKIK